jgi:hypothetical protein
MLKKTFSALTIVAALGGSMLVPATAMAQSGVELRFYDRSHKDYHHWNNDEDHFYRQYLTEHHRKYRTFSHMSKQQQREYWKWRHDHDGR